MKRQREEEQRAQAQASNDRYDLPPEEEDEVSSSISFRVLKSPHLLIQGKAGGISAIALYDYQAMAEDEISFDPNDIITNIEMVNKHLPFIVYFLVVPCLCPHLGVFVARLTRAGG